MTDLIIPLRHFVRDMTALVNETDNEAILIQKSKSLLAKLISEDVWLPGEFAQEATGRYAQYLLHCDPLERFCVVSFVWGKGQFTPVHNHTIWGIVGVLRGAELCDEFDFKGGKVFDLGRSHKMLPGQVEVVSPTIGDWHRVSNASEGTSISIHVYGGNIGTTRRNCLNEAGQLVDFVSRYDNQMVPNLWRSL